MHTRLGRTRFSDVVLADMLGFPPDCTILSIGRSFDTGDIEISWRSSKCSCVPDGEVIPLVNVKGEKVNCFGELLSEV